MAEIHQSDPDRRPDDEFEPGRYRNDSRRIAEIESIATLFDRTMRVAVDPATRENTDTRIARLTDEARAWLRENSTFLVSGDPLPAPETREGDRRLCADFERFITERGLWDIEEPFAAKFVSAPFGEMIKGHRLVFAELGLVAYEGKVIRDAMLFEAPWSKDRRAEHIVARLAFIRAVAMELGVDRFTLYRGISTEGELTAPRNDTFVSASFARAVAESLAGGYGEDANFRLLTQQVPVQRVFMTYLETAAMNEQFREAEAVLLYEPGNREF